MKSAPKTNYINYLNQRNISIRKFAEYTGMTRNMIQKFLNGIYDLTEEQQLKVQQAIAKIELNHTKTLQKVNSETMDESPEKLVARQRASRATDIIKNHVANLITLQTPV